MRDQHTELSEAMLKAFRQVNGKYKTLEQIAEAIGADFPNEEMAHWVSDMVAQGKLTVKPIAPKPLKDHYVPRSPAPRTTVMFYKLN